MVTTRQLLCEPCHYPIVAQFNQPSSGSILSVKLCRDFHGLKGLVIRLPNTKKFLIVISGKKDF